jgi:hypothetical protein
MIAQSATSAVSSLTCETKAIYIVNLFPILLLARKKQLLSTRYALSGKRSSKMKVIIAGGRNYQITKSDIEILDRLNAIYKFSEVVSGDCSGADRAGALWAIAKKIPVKHFPADWDNFGRRAGPMRNREMADYADAAILFSGGAGTASMRCEALRLGVEILYDGGE